MKTMKLKKKRKEEKINFSWSDFFYNSAKSIIRMKKERGEDLNTEELDNLIAEIHKVAGEVLSPDKVKSWDELLNLYYYMGVSSDNPNIAIRSLKFLLVDFEIKREEKLGIFRPKCLYDPNDWKKKIKNNKDEKI